MEQQVNNNNTSVLDVESSLYELFVYGKLILLLNYTTLCCTWKLYGPMKRSTFQNQNNLSRFDRWYHKWYNSAFIKHLAPHRWEYWDNIIEPATAEAYNVRVLVCLPELFWHVCTLNTLNKLVI